MTQLKLVLIDGHALAYRVFYGLPMDSFTTKAGEPTNATFGFVRTLLDLIQSPAAPQYLAVSFDVSKTFRDELFAEYKGTRAKMPDELGLQIERIKQVIQAMNIPILELDGYEADDVIGTISRQAATLGVPVHIITGDRDLLQLVDDNTTVELPPGQYEKLPQQFDVAAVLAKFEVPPPRIVDYKALVGDSSDNIPGVKGIGDKTAKTLLKEYGTLDGIYANLGNLKGAVAKKLTEGKESAYLSYRLATIVTHAPIQLNLKACLLHDFETEPVLTLFQQLEFRSLSRRLLEVAETLHKQPEPAVLTTTQTIIVGDKEGLHQLAKALNHAKWIAFDTETTGLDRLTARLVGISLAVQPGIAYYIPLGHVQLENAGISPIPEVSSSQLGLFDAGTPQPIPHQLPIQETLNALRPALTNPQIPKVGHNAKFDYAILQGYGLTVTPITFDTQLAEWLCDPNSKHLGLKDLALHRLGADMTNIETLIGSGKTQKSFDYVPIELAAPYAAADADMTLRLKNVLQPELREKRLEKLFTEVEIPLVPVLAAMERAGIAVDLAVFSQISAELKSRLSELEVIIHQIAGTPFNISSTQQLSDVLFKKLNILHEKIRKTKSGHYSTASDVLESLLEVDHTGIIQHLLEYRELEKLKNTYADALPALVNPQTGRIHTHFNQTGSVTGRLASNTPNLQNIPIRTEIGRQLRRGFVARPGWVLLAADYSQVELRILAHVSQDSALLQAFHENQDIHRTTAATVHNISPEQVTFEQRRFAKAVNFGLIYGMGAYRLARDSSLTLAEAEEFIKVYFDRFPGIRRYLDQTKKLAHDQGYVETLMGRRRYFPALKSGTSNHDVRTRTEREAVNHPIQGTAAEIIKIAMIRLHEKMPARYQAQMLLQVHDELLFELPTDEVEPVQALVKEVMSTAYQLDVPLKVETGIGSNWYELKG